MGTFKGQPKTKEQIKAQDAARTARKAGRPLPKVELVPEDLEPKEDDGLLAKVAKKRKRRKRDKKAKIKLEESAKEFNEKALKAAAELSNADKKDK